MLSMFVGSSKPGAGIPGLDSPAPANGAVKQEGKNERDLIKNDDDLTPGGQQRVLKISVNVRDIVFVTGHPTLKE